MAKTISGPIDQSTLTQPQTFKEDAMKFNVRRFVFRFVLVCILAAVPVLTSTMIDLWCLGAPPVVVLEDGSVVGQTPLTAWPGTFWRALFNFAPPESFDDLVNDYWWLIFKVLFVTGALLLAFSAVCAWMREDLEDVGKWVFVPEALMAVAIAFTAALTCDRAVGLTREPGEPMSDAYATATLVYGGLVALVSLVRAHRMKLGPSSDINS